MINKIHIQDIRNYLFLALGFSIPISTALISITFVLLVFLWFFDNNLNERIKEIRCNKFFTIILGYLAIHFVGFLWLQVEPVNAMKSWMIFAIPLLSTGVDSNYYLKGLKAFVLGMFVYVLLFDINIILDPSYFFEAYIEFTSVYMFSNSHVSYSPLVALTFAILLPAFLVSKEIDFKYLFLLLFFALNEFLVAGRTGYIVFIFASFFVISYYHKENIMRLIIAIFSIIGIIGLTLNLNPIFENRINQTNITPSSLSDKDISSTSSSKFENADVSIDRRYHWANETIKLIKDKPFFGYGTGSFENEFKNYSDRNTQVLYTYDPHNHHLLVLFQFGLFGFTAYILIYLIQIRTALSYRKDNILRSFAILLPLVYLLMNFSATYFWEHHLQAFFAFTSAILYNTNMRDRQYEKIL